MSATESWHVTRTLRALEVLALGPHSAAEVADALLVHPRTARRLLNRLVAEGYATRTRDTRRRYVSTLRLVAVAGQVVEHTEVVQAAGDYLSRVQQETGGTVHLSVPSLVSALCVLHDSGIEQRAVPSIGERIPSHATAGGKALLAFRPAWRAHVMTQPLEPFTARTLVEAHEFEADVLTTRARGYAVERGEYRPDACGVAAPVFSHTGEAVAALGVSATAHHLVPQRLPVVGGLVAEIAAAISEELGYDGTARSRELDHG